MNSPDTSSLKVLLVDDEPDVLELLVETLQEKGFRAMTASSKDEALSLVKLAPVDVIVTDIRMPGGSGIELLEEVSKLQDRRPALLFLSAHPIPLQEVYEKGGDGILAKPLEATTLAAAIRHFGSGRWAKRNLEREMDRQKEINLINSKMVLLGETSSGIAHEIKAPLGVINLEIKQILSRGNLSEELKKSVNKIGSMAERIEKIVGAMSAYSRKSDDDPLANEEVGKLIDESIELVSRKFHLSSVKLEYFRGDSPISVGINCRGSQIIQVLVNILNNACDAVADSPEDKWVRIETVQERDNVLISITDSGKGIPKEVQDKLFGSFFTTKPKGKGTGLGLSISHRIIKEHGGELSIDGDCANTRFLIRLPLNN